MPVTYRLATLDDQAAILKVFEELAYAVPTVFDEGTPFLVERLLRHGMSWLAVGAAGNVLGYALVTGNGKETELNYLGVTEAAQGAGISSALVGKVQEPGISVFTDVRHDNKSSMVERFEHFGFVKCAPDPFSDQRTKLRWAKLADADDKTA